MLSMLTETGLSGGLAYTNNLLPAAPVGLLGLLLLFQVNHCTVIVGVQATVVTRNLVAKLKCSCLRSG